jgi:muramidase (phage lysozyme)
MTMKVVGALPDPYFSGSKRTTKGRKNNPNRYTYRIGVVQQIIREVVQYPNQWVLVREGSKNRSSLAPTLQKYEQIRFSTRKREDGLFDIYVMYTPDRDGQPNKMLSEALADWELRERNAKVAHEVKSEASGH